MQNTIDDTLAEPTELVHLNYMKGSILTLLKIINLDLVIWT